MNALGDELADRADPDDPTSTPVLGSGHPMADIMLLKTSAQPAEIQEGVAFFGRAGSAILKSVTRVGIDRIKVPLAEQIDPELFGEVQQLTPTIETLVTPDIDESLDEESSKRKFWKAFQELGRWYSALPPY